MDDQNVIIYLDKIKKLIELGNKPKAITEIDAIMVMLNKKMARKNGKLFQLIVIPQATETERSNPIFMRDFELGHKMNEILTFLNDRFGP